MRAPSSKPTDSETNMHRRGPERAATIAAAAAQMTARERGRRDQQQPIDISDGDRRQQPLDAALRRRARCGRASSTAARR